MNFLRRFITNFVEVVKYVNNLLKKDDNFKWYVEDKQSFTDIKRALSKLICR